MHQLTGITEPPLRASSRRWRYSASSKTKANIAATLDEIGILQQLSGDYPAAAASLQQALQLFRDLDAQRAVAYVLKNLGAVHTASGNYQAAAAYLQQALQLLGDLGARHAEAEALNNLGDLLIHSASSREAYDRHAKALAIARIGALADSSRRSE